MKSTDPLLTAWENTLDRAGNRPALFTTRGDMVRTFADVESRARELERMIQRFAPESVIAIQIGNHDDWPAIFIACLRRGLVVLPLEQSMSEQQRDEALNICNAAAVISAKPGRGGSPEPPIVVPLHTHRRAIEVNRPYLGTTSLLKLTSGTTAAPRAVRFRSEQLLADCDQICRTMGISEGDLNFGVIPISHSYGFSNLLTPLIACAVPMVLSRDRTPRAILADLARTNATVLPGTPVFFQSLCQIENAPPLPKLRLCISAGAPLPIGVAKMFREKFRLPIHSFYGASECGGICYDREGANDTDGFVGAAMEGIELELVNPEAESSQVRVRTAAAGDGYFPEPDEEKLGAGTFVPDDLLARVGAGFTIVGRISDLINVAGKKVTPAEVEAYLRRCPGVREAVVFGRKSGWRNEEVAACIVVDGDLRESDLLEFSRRGLSEWQVPKRIFIVDAIPTNEQGKISRRELAERFARQ